MNQMIALVLENITSNKNSGFIDKNLDYQQRTNKQNQLKT